MEIPSEPFRTVIEPFRIHAVEPLAMTTPDHRGAAIRAAGYNLFTSPVRRAHRPADRLGHRGDEPRPVGGHPARRRVLRGITVLVPSSSDAVNALFPFRHVIPTHQGRAAEKILFTVVGGPGKVIPSNTHFDTTRANIEFTGAEAVDLVIAEGRDPKAAAPVQGQPRHGRARGVARGRGGANVPARDGDGDEQLGGRPAGEPGEPPRRAGGLRPARHAAVPRRLPFRRERLVHPSSASRARRDRTWPTSCARWSRWPTG